MKCIPECGFVQKPDNIMTLQKHMQDCFLNGAMKDIDDAPAIVWKDGELHIVFEAEDHHIVLHGSPTVVESPVAEEAPKKKAAPRKKKAESATNDE